MSTPNFLQVKYQGINIPSQSTSVAANAGDIGYNSSTNKFAVWNTAADNLVTELTAQTLSNKSINASTNTISNITNANLSGSAGITNANLAQMAANTVKANTTGSSALPSDVALGTVTEATSAVLTLTGWSDATIGSPTIRVSQSTTSTSGYLSSTDWNTFNNKQPAGSYITALTGQVTASGPGSATATIATNTVSNSNLAQMPADTIKGNNTGSTANASDLTVAQVNAILPVFTSSLNGLVPASGGGTANFLRADGTWNPAPGTVTSVGLAAPAIFTVTNSPVTSSGTLTLSYSGSALPIANGGTNATTAAAAYNNLSPMTTTGDIEYEASAGVAARLPIGTSGQVLAVQSGLPAWINPSQVGSVVASYYLSATYTPSAGSPIVFNTKVIDTNNAYNSSTGVFTAPVSGNYIVTANVNTTGGPDQVVIYINGVAYMGAGLTPGQANVEGSFLVGATVPCLQGQTISLNSTGGAPYQGGVKTNGATSSISICLASGSSTAAVVAASYYMSTITTPGANVQLNFDTKLFDTNSAVTTGVGAWKFTAPNSGYYFVSTTTSFNSGTASDISIFKNGTRFNYIGYCAASTQISSSSAAIQLNAGDFIDIRGDTSTTYSASGETQISIYQIH